MHWKKKNYSARVLLQTHNLPKQIATTDSLQSFSVSISDVKYFTRPDRVNKLLSNKFQYFNCQSVFLLLVIRYKRSHLFYTAVHCNVWPAWPGCARNGTIFWKKSTEYSIFFLIFSTNFVWNISHSKKNSATFYHKCT